MADLVSPRLKRDYEIKKVKAFIKWAAKRASETFAEQQQARLMKTQILSYEITGGKVYLQLEGGSKTIPSGTFTKYHYLEGTGVKGIQGLISNDFSFQIDSTKDVKYDTSEANKPFTVPKTPCYVYSEKTVLGYVRPKITEDSWTRMLGNFAKNKVNGRKLTYEDMPHWDSEFNPNRGQWFGVTTYDPAPTSYQESIDGIEQDDVDWWNSLRLYAIYCDTEYHKAVKERNDALKAYNLAAGLVGQPKITPPGKDGAGKSDKKGDDVTPPSSSGSLSGIGDDTKPVIYNLPAVKDMYFRSDDLANFKIESGNLPTKVASAEKLWTDSLPYKGMIQSYIVPASLSKDNGTWWSPDNTKNGIKGENKRINTRRYGFQFQYNPSTVTMAFAGAPQVDIGLETSGQDKVPLIGSSVTSSTVTFQLLINRMNDFKYLDAMLRVNDKLDVKEIYSHTGNHWSYTQQPGTKAEVTSIHQELQQIKELGTMYDIEYLLRVLLGYQLKSSLRNRFTSDIGYLGAYPVELHLGNNLRYLGIIDSFNVSHTIFNQNMVPVFSNVSITFSRLPDFAKPFNEVPTSVKNVDPNSKDGNA